MEEDEHIDELWLPHLEGFLNPQQRVEVESHLAVCPHCASEFQKRIKWKNLLEASREIFCPNPWEVFDQARHAEVEKEPISQHLEECASCRELGQAFNRPIPLTLNGAKTHKMARPPHNSGLIVSHELTPSSELVP